MVLLAACAHPDRVPAAAAKDAPPRPEGFQSKLNADHPLVGKVWMPAEARFATDAEVARKLTASRFVLLGEKHDNVDAHLYQDWMLRTVVASGRKPAVAFEMLETDQQQKVDAARAANSGADGIALAVDWANSGWPDFSMYAPVFQTAVVEGLPIIAANIPKPLVKNLVHEGLAALPPEQVKTLGLEEPLPPQLDASLREELERGHCGMLPQDVVVRMVPAERARDATMALRMVEGATKDGAVLIAGSGHTRKDRGVPRELAKRDSSASVASVGFVEVDPEATEPKAYAHLYSVETLPFDFVVFLPRANDVDACAEFRKQMQEHMKGK